MSTAVPPSAPAPPPGDERATSEVLTSLLANGQALVAKEIELAKLELGEVVRDKVIALGLAVFAGLLGLFVLGFVGVTGAVALSLVLPAWAAWLIVTGIYLLVAVILILVAIRFVKRDVFARTKTSVEETKTWAKGQVQA